jgi:hypothetical protein
MCVCVCVCQPAGFLQARAAVLEEVARAVQLTQAQQEPTSNKHVYVCLCVYVCVYVSLCVRACVWVCVGVCICVCVSVRAWVLCVSVSRVRVRILQLRE